MTFQSIGELAEKITEGLRKTIDEETKANLKASDKLKKSIEGLKRKEAAE